MLTVKDLSKAKRELYAFLGGEPYEIKVIDLEVCLSLTIGDYAIEISGGGKKRNHFYIYVWHMLGYHDIVECYPDLKCDFVAVQKLLNTIRLRYGDKLLLSRKTDAIPIHSFIKSYGKYVGIEEAEKLDLWCKEHTITHYVPDDYIRNSQGELIKDTRHEQYCLSQYLNCINSSYLLIDVFVFKTVNGTYCYTAQPYINEKMKWQVCFDEFERRKLEEDLDKKGMALSVEPNKAWIEPENRTLLVLQWKANR